MVRIDRWFAVVRSWGPDLLRWFESDGVSRWFESPIYEFFETVVRHYSSTKVARESVCESAKVQDLFFEFKSSSIDLRSWGSRLWLVFTVVFTLVSGSSHLELIDSSHWNVQSMEMRNLVFKRKVLYFVYGVKNSVRGLHLASFGSSNMVSLFNHGVKRSEKSRKILNYITRALASCLIGATLGRMYSRKKLPSRWRYRSEDIDVDASDDSDGSTDLWN
ncbi:hypothetical protein K1719_047322 [Acacia pycnantha]|nr:hypothetical protein K1719_047322 [Acacia pycnantha]